MSPIRTTNASIDLLVIGFGTSVAMWAVAYVMHLPSMNVPGAVKVLLLVACLLAGGILCGRTSGRGIAGGAAAGVVTALVNLLVLGSLLGGETPNQVVPAAALWVPGSFALSACVMGLGAWIGARRPGGRAHPPDWIAALSAVAAASTLLLVIIGGVVTSQKAGLAVVDWPNSFGYNMLLYPLSRMTGGIYYEHSHRLFGMLVGLTTLVQAVVLQLLDDRRWLKRIAWGALALVALQGILGGLRVTGHFTLATSPSEVAPSIVLAVVHGATGQVFFATMVCLAVFTSPSWKNASQTSAAARSARHAWPWLLVALLIVQLVLGAIQRHLAHGLVLHIVMAVFVTVIALIVGLQAWSGRAGTLPIQRFGLAVVIAVSAQVFLGLGTYVAIGGAASGTLSPIVRVVISTAHQATGAVVLACAVGLALWNSRAVEVARADAAR